MNLFARHAYSQRRRTVDSTNNSKFFHTKSHPQSYHRLNLTGPGAHRIMITITGRHAVLALEFSRISSRRGPFSTVRDSFAFKLGMQIKKSCLRFVDLNTTRCLDRILKSFVYTNVPGLEEWAMGEARCGWCQVRHP